MKKPDAFKFIRKHQDKIKAHIRQKEIEEYKGNNVTCVICGSEFDRFAPVYAWVKEFPQGMTKVEDVAPTRSSCIVINESARCPDCGSLERHRLLWKYLHERTDIFNLHETRLLEFAPDEFFFNTFRNLEHLSYFPCDIDPSQQKYQNYKGCIIRADITHLQFSDDFFDVILCSHVLEHVTNDNIAMSELFRVMKKGGWGIIQVPLDQSRQKTFEDSTITSAEGREKAFGQKDHVRIYGKDFSGRLTKAGFSVKEVAYVKEFSAQETARFGFDPDEIIYLCEKLLE